MAFPLIALISTLGQMAAKSAQAQAAAKEDVLRRSRSMIRGSYGQPNPQPDPSNAFLAGNYPPLNQPPAVAPLETGLFLRRFLQGY